VSRTQSHDGLEHNRPAPGAPEGEVFSWLPRLLSRQVRLERILSRFSEAGKLPPALSWFEKATGNAIAVDRPEVLWRASGVARPSLVAQLTAPRLATHLGLGIEVPLAHAIVDRLLGFDRPMGEGRLQLTPVEWGVWTFLILRALESWDARSARGGKEIPADPSLLSARDLTLDRVGPGPFEPVGLSSVVTIRWPVRVGEVAGSVRLWMAESIVELWLAAEDDSSASRGDPSTAREDRRPTADASRSGKTGELSSSWRAAAGFVTLPQGLRRLRVGGVLPLADTRLVGAAANPTGPIDLVLDFEGRSRRYRVPCRPAADSGGRFVRIDGGLMLERRPRDPVAASKSESRSMSQSPTASNPVAAPQGVAPLDVPVTLTVELGRVNLTVAQLADLKPGDIVELHRHSRAPVELTSSGRLVARGELVMIDTDLGVRVTSVFL
jgi:type III secretion system YscQ/HrcQ family protein